MASYGRYIMRYAYFKKRNACQPAVKIFNICLSFIKKLFIDIEVH